MRILRVVMFSAVVWTVAASVKAQRPSGESAAGAVRAEIDEVEAEIEKALVERDRSALDRLLADPFTWVHASDARVDTRSVFLENAREGMALSGQRNQRAERGITLDVHGAPAHTAIRTSRVQLRPSAGSREIWIRQVRTYVKTPGGWKLASGQGTLMYEGPLLDQQLHARYAGVYRISADRSLTLTWEDDALMARFPTGARTQIFLASPTEEAGRTSGAGVLRFELGSDGIPKAVLLVRGGEVVWRAERE